MRVSRALGCLGLCGVLIGGACGDRGEANPQDGPAGEGGEGGEGGEAGEAGGGPQAQAAQPGGPAEDPGGQTGMEGHSGMEASCQHDLSEGAPSAADLQTLLAGPHAVELAYWPLYALQPNPETLAVTVSATPTGEGWRCNDRFEQEVEATLRFEQAAHEVTLTGTARAQSPQQAWAGFEITRTQLDPVGLPIPPPSPTGLWVFPLGMHFTPDALDLQFGTDCGAAVTLPVRRCGEREIAANQPINGVTPADLLSVPSLNRSHAIGWSSEQLRPLEDQTTLSVEAMPATYACTNAAVGPDSVRGIEVHTTLRLRSGDGRVDLALAARFYVSLGREREPSAVALDDSYHYRAETLFPRAALDGSPGRRLDFELGAHELVYVKLQYDRGANDGLQFRAEGAAVDTRAFGAGPEQPLDLSQPGKSADCLGELAPIIWAVGL